MFDKRWIVMAALFSFGALAEVTYEEKQNRVQYLEELTKSATSMNIEAYRRELGYEKLALSAEQRAAHEANLLAETIKNQIIKTYDASLAESGDENTAMAEVRAAIEKDLLLVDPALHDDLKAIAFDALENVQRGSSHSENDLSNLEKSLIKGVRDRMNFFNEEGDNELPLAMMNSAAVNSQRDAERKNYNTKNEILSSLVSDGESVRWMSGAGITLKSTAQKRVDTKISLQIKTEFLGVSVEAGPSISFKREYSSQVNLVAEGLNPVLLNDGNFDFYMRDRANRIIKKGGKDQRRLISFACEVDLDFETDYVGEGGFSFAGVGAKTTIGKKFVNKVNLTSRRILVPEYINNQSVTYRYLTTLCHNDFLNARITNTMTIQGSLNMMMKNVVASLRFSHPKTKCAVDSQCVNWYNQQLPLVRSMNFPRCAEESREKFRACVHRGLQGQNCAVFDKTGKRVSDGMFEFTCDKGLKCVQYKEAGWFKGFDIYQYAKGKCMPINPRTYISPMARIINVELVRK